MTQFNTNQFVAPPVNVLSPVTPDATANIGNILSASVAFAGQANQRAIASKQAKTAEAEINARERMQKLSISAATAQNALDAELSRSEMRQQQTQFEESIAQAEKDREANQPGKDAQTEAIKTSTRLNLEENDRARVNSDIERVKGQIDTLTAQEAIAAREGTQEEQAELAERMHTANQEMAAAIMEADSLQRAQREGFTKAATYLGASGTAFANMAVQEKRMQERNADIANSVISSAGQRVISETDQAGLGSALAGAGELVVDLVDWIFGANSTPADITGEGYINNDGERIYEGDQGRMTTGTLDTRSGQIFRPFREDGTGLMDQYFEEAVDGQVYSQEEADVIKEVLKAQFLTNYTEIYLGDGVGSGFKRDEFNLTQAELLEQSRAKLDAATENLNANPGAKAKANHALTAMRDMGTAMLGAEQLGIGDGGQQGDAEILGKLYNSTYGDLKNNYEAPDFEHMGQIAGEKFETVLTKMREGSLGDPSLVFAEVRKEIEEGVENGYLTAEGATELRSNMEKLLLAAQEGLGIQDEMKDNSAEQIELQNDLSVMRTASEANIERAEAEAATRFAPKKQELLDELSALLGIDIDYDVEPEDNS